MAMQDRVCSNGAGTVRVSGKKAVQMSLVKLVSAQ